MELIDLGQQGVIGGSVAAVTGNNPLHPLYFTYQTFYPANSFTTDTVK
jgi:3-deoxy-D-manno-octulosonic-acid transferase